MRTRAGCILLKVAAHAASLAATAAILVSTDKALGWILPDGIAHAISPDRSVVLLAISLHLQYRGDLVAAYEAGVRLR